MVLFHIGRQTIQHFQRTLVGRNLVRNKRRKKTLHLSVVLYVVIQQKQKNATTQTKPNQTKSNQIKPDQSIRIPGIESRTETCDGVARQERALVNQQKITHFLHGGQSSITHMTQDFLVLRRRILRPSIQPR
jgi:hypothetical protein